MQHNTGKLITVWVPGTHGAGGSTIADSLGIGLPYFTGKKTCLINLSGQWSYMERFLENDINMPYTMDSLKSFGSSLTTEHIFNFATKINNNLFIIPGSKINDALSGVGRDFEIKLVELCLKEFDIVVADVTARVQLENDVFLDRADQIIAVMTANEIMLEDIYNSTARQNIRRYLQKEKTTAVFNMLPEDWDVPSTLKKLKQRYGFKSLCGLQYNGRAFEACCVERKFYSFLAQELQKLDTPFSNQLMGLYQITAHELDFDIHIHQKQNWLTKLLRKKVG